MSWVPVYVTGMLCFGSLNTLTTKIQWTLYSVGLAGEMKRFEKPWFACLLMFLAMTAVGIIDILKTRRRKRIGMLEEPLDSKSAAKVQEHSELRTFLQVGVPAVLDLVATGIGLVGFVYIPSSTYQMLRGAMIVFSAIESVYFLGRRMRCFNWLGVICCTCGISLVGLANALESQKQARERQASGAPSVDPSLALFGVGMVILAQLFQATQCIVEEKLLQGYNIPPMKVVGYEGIWGSILMVIIVMPLLQFTPGHDVGSQENTIDTLTMLSNNKALCELVLLYVFSCATYNIAGMQVTGALSAVHRTMLEASRTMIIWIFDLFVHYEIDSTSMFSEEWSVYSWIQLAGFFTVIMGQGIYGGLIRLPCFDYGSALPPENPASPAAMRVMSPGLPAAFEEDDEHPKDMTMSGLG